MLNVSNMTHTALLGQIIGRNIAVIRHRYAICVVDINVKHVHRQYPSSQAELS